MATQVKSRKKNVEQLVKSHPDKSGVIALPDGYDAFAARLMLTNQAVSTLDIQYYIWENDLTGTVMFEALYRAAERGVHVRILIDDNNTHELDPMLATLHSHPNIEIRLFNPFINRGWLRFLHLPEFMRLNKRMHNKSFTADNHVSILGGRNIGDDYFNAGQDLIYLDLDVLTVGKVVKDITMDFERYWESEMAHPVHRILERNSQKNIDTLTSASLIEKDPSAGKYMDALNNSKFSRDLVNLPFEWTNVRFVSDDPTKALENFSSDHMLLQEKLLNIVGLPIHELLLIVPYFVPGKEGVKFFRYLRKKDVQVKILTNSYEATDVAMVHAGYSKHRRKLLEWGVKLYELKANFADFAIHDPKLTSRTASSLHAKTFCIDRSIVFIGSCNFDPRSSLLNTEMGVLIESSSMAQKAADLFTHSIPARSYEVCLNNHGKMLWIDRSNGSEIILEKEPGLDIFHRAGVSFYSKLPIEWLL